MRTILLISPYWKEEHRWMVSSYKLAALWQSLGFRVVVACMGNVGSELTVQGLRSDVRTESDTLKIYTMQDVFFKDPWNYGVAWGFTSFVKKIIRDEKPEYIVANKVLFWTSISVVLLRLAGKKVTVLTDALVGMTWWPRPTVAKVCAAVYAWTLGWLILLCAKRVVFFHPQPVKLLSLLGIRKKSQVIPTGIDVQGYNVQRSALQRVTVTYVGRLESVKGVDDFLAAAVPLKAAYSHLEIQVVGWYRDNHPLVEQYKNDVTFTGRRDDIATVLSESDIFVLPSYSEGLSNALMEAMASGCACIASAVGGNRYLLNHGEVGRLFPAGDRTALGMALVSLIESASERQMLGAAARKRIEEMFDWTVVGKQYTSLFEQEYRNIGISE